MKNQELGLPWKYKRHHYKDARGHIYLSTAEGACMIHLTGAASMKQADLDARAEFMVKAANKKAKVAELLREIRKAAKLGQESLDANGTMVGYEDFEAIKALVKQALAQL